MPMSFYHVSTNMEETMDSNSMDALFSGLTRPRDETVMNEGREGIKGKETKSVSIQEAPKAKKKERFCTIVDTDTLRKIRIIASREGLQIKEVVNAAFDRAIAVYERRHGKVDGDMRTNPKDLF